MTYRGKSDSPRLFPMKFRASGRLPLHRKDGSTVYRKMVLVEPAQYAGQVRDITVHADGSVSLGPDVTRTSE